MTENISSPAPPPRRPFLRGCAVVALVIGAFFVLLTVVSRFDTGAFARRPKVAVLPITGLIADSREIIDQLRTFAKDDLVKAIVLRINSGGGGVGPSQEIYAEVRKLQGKKIVLTSMGALAASGGYYIACASEKIYANPGTITGSIGVIMPLVNVRELAEKIGIRGMEVKSAPFKNIGSPLHDMSPEERTLLQGVIDNVHAQFVNAVIKGRNLPLEEVAAIADGRIFSGEQALALGLIDALGTQEDAVAEAGKLAGIVGEPRIVMPPRKRISILDLIRSELVSIIDQKLAESRFRIDYRIR
jgi:protease IV